MQVTLVGVDHRSASAEIRERLYLSPEAISRLLASIRDVFPGCEAFVLATCNRTELLFAEPAGGRAFEAWHLLVREAVQGHALAASDAGATDEPCGDPAARRYTLHGEAAAEHLLRVASGLDSAVLGDVDLVGQIRIAIELAQTAGTLGKHLHALLRRALACGKRVRSETALAAGGAGIGSAVAALVADRTAPDSDVVVLGAGAAAAGVVTQLAKRGHGRVTIVNRTRGRAEELAATVGARVGDDLAAELVAADVLVAVVAAGHVVVGEDLLDRVVAERGRDARLLAIDACLPHVVASHAAVDLVALDEIAAHREGVLREREEAIPAAEAIVAEELREWAMWLQCADLDEVIARLYRDAEARLRELADVLPPHRHRELRAEVRRALHTYVSSLRAAAA